MKARSKSWWDRCVAAVNRGAKSYDPEAVCGALLRDKRRAGIGEGGRKASARGRGPTARGRSSRGKSKSGCGCKH